MNDLIAVGLYIGGIWALSLLGLKSIRDSQQAEEKLKDACEAAIIATNIVGSIAAAFALGVGQINTWGAGIQAVLIFTVPFLAMGAVYKKFKRRGVTWMSVIFVAVFTLLSMGMVFNWIHLGDAVIPGP